MISGRTLVSSLIVGLISFALHANSQTQDDINADSPHAPHHESDLQERLGQELVPEALIDRLKAKWRAEAVAGTSEAKLSEEHRALLADALSRVNWTPFCSYTEESVLPDEKEARIRHHSVEFDRDALERLIERAAASHTDVYEDSDAGESDGFETSLDEFAGMRQDLAAAKVVDATELAVIYDLPVPRERIEDEASPEDMGRIERRFMKNLMENLRVRFTVDVKNRGPKLMHVELIKPVRIIPGLKVKKMSFSTNFRYLEDVQEFAVDRNASEIGMRAFLVAGFSEIETETLSDFQCLRKG